MERAGDPDVEGEVPDVGMPGERPRSDEVPISVVVESEIPPGESVESVGCISEVVRSSWVVDVGDSSWVSVGVL